jgi:hypothetical protein
VLSGELNRAGAPLNHLPRPSRPGWCLDGGIWENAADAVLCLECAGHANMLLPPLVNNSVDPNVKAVSALRGLPWSQAAVWSNRLITPRDGKVPMRDVFASPSGDRFAEVILFLVWIARDWRLVGNGPT